MRLGKWGFLMWFRLAFPLIFMFAPRLIPRLVRTAYLVWKLTFDHRVPLLLKLLVPASLIYLVTPFSRLPYGVGLVGFLMLLSLAVFILINFAPRNVVESYAPWRARSTTGSSSRREDPSKVVEGSYHLMDDQDPTE